MAALRARLQSPASAEDLSPLSGMPYILVEGGEAPGIAPGWAPNCPVIALGSIDAHAEIVDLAVSTEAEAEQVIEAIEHNPIASMTLVRLLRHNARTDVPDRLFARVADVFHAATRHRVPELAPDRRRRPRAPEPDAPLVLAERSGGELRLTLNRPHKRNAYSAELRDALCEALQLVADDPGIERAILSGAGACFSAGGDLDEFGEATDAGRAHASRMTRSAALLMHALRDRIEARLHGACIGAGIELPAFAGHVKARPDAFFQLPEVSMGLVPGAGGTASIPATHRAPSPGLDGPHRRADRRDDRAVLGAGRRGGAVVRRPTPMDGALRSRIIPTVTQRQ